MWQWYHVSNISLCNQFDCILLFGFKNGHKHQVEFLVITSLSHYSHIYTLLPHIPCPLLLDWSCKAAKKKRNNFNNISFFFFRWTIWNTTQEKSIPKFQTAEKPRAISSRERRLFLGHSTIGGEKVSKKKQFSDSCSSSSFVVFGCYFEEEKAISKVLQFADIFLISLARSTFS